MICLLIPPQVSSVLFASVCYLSSMLFFLYMLINFLNYRENFFSKCCYASEAGFENIPYPLGLSGIFKNLYLSGTMQTLLMNWLKQFVCLKVLGLYAC